MPTNFHDSLMGDTRLMNLRMPLERTPCGFSFSLSSAEDLSTGLPCGSRPGLGHDVLWWPIPQIQKSRFGTSEGASALGVGGGCKKKQNLSRKVFSGWLGTSQLPLLGVSQEKQHSSKESWAFPFEWPQKALSRNPKLGTFQCWLPLQCRPQKERCEGRDLLAAKCLGGNWTRSTYLSIPMANRVRRLPLQGVLFGVPCLTNGHD